MSSRNTIAAVLPIVCLALLLMLPGEAVPTYRLEIRAESYSNVDHVDAAGICCEVLGAKTHCDAWYYCGWNCDCDNKFYFCLRGAGTRRDGDKDNCPLGSYRTGGIGGDSFSFDSSSIASGVPNPIPFTGSVWPGAFQFYIKVVDEDIAYNDHVDDVYVDKTLSPSSSFTSVQTFTGDHGNSRIGLSFRVQCLDNYYGSDCATFCVRTDNSNGHYSCGSSGQKVCLTGWSQPATNCLTAICSSSCHFVGGYCTVPGECLCRPGWTGGNCDQCIPPAACSTTGGYCDLPGQCNCFPGYDGVNCEIDTLPCQRQSPCHNNATCINDGVGGYTCHCQPGYTGDVCETEINECETDPCQNGGSCTDLVDDYSCACSPGWEGKNCSVDTDDCLVATCLNGGTCNDLLDDYSCMCAPGFFGLDCGTEVDECLPRPCINQGTCVDLVNGFSCTCLPEFTGAECEIDLNKCRSAPCLNGGTCENGQCQCPKGYTGYNCELQMQACLSSPCQNGTCTDRPNDEYYCSCDPNYSGTNCDIYDPSSSRISAIVVVVIEVILLVLVVIIVVYVYVRCFAKKKNSYMYHRLKMNRRMGSDGDDDDRGQYVSVSKDSLLPYYDKGQYASVGNDQPLPCYDKGQYVSVSNDPPPPYHTINTDIMPDMHNYMAL